MRTKGHPFDLTWASPNLRERIEWQVEIETLGSDHLVISMKMELAMNSEKIKIKPRIDAEEFLMKIEEIDVSEAKDLAKFVELINGAREKATTRPQVLKNPKFIPKSYWNERVREIHKKKKEAMIKYFRSMTTKNWIECKKYNAIMKKR